MQIDSNMNQVKPPEPTSDVPALPERAETTHKAQVGRIAIIAGSRGMSGAACLSALGALRGGAGLVRVLTPASAQPIVAASDPCLMTVPLPETADGLVNPVALSAAAQESMVWADVLAIGPGLGQVSDLGHAIVVLLKTFQGPIVIDADGLNAIAGFGLAAWADRRERPTILTPHPGEMARLRNGAGLNDVRGNDDQTRLQIAFEYAQPVGVTVLLKGHRTVVCNADQAYINTTGNPGMATGGMGDVLTGLIAALLGQGLSGFDAACLAAYCHGHAADLCARQIGPVGYLSRDVAKLLPAALAQENTILGFR